jgi:DNA-binding NarL/FixJ family response regulator
MTAPCGARVVVIDDDDDVRDLLTLLLDLDERFTLVGAAESGAAGVELVRALVPDVVVVDLELPGMDGLEVVNQVAGLALDIRIVVFSAFPDPFTLVDVLHRGADAYLDKASAWSELLPTLASFFHVSSG